ncbi:hypothetical protein [Arthrobacter sp. M4]|uniref:hypothetical protein n=1 Tax=Arthrobacter sp. M4 TaxID=218160 RepID=UPI001CDC53F3|nr:hypothetical protein [Arthrobacter sp. M4]MCA4133394.1 hypothetical protein [Arthrobacter sp. M4]
MRHILDVARGGVPYGRGYRFFLGQRGQRTVVNHNPSNRESMVMSPPSRYGHIFMNNLLT